MKRRHHFVPRFYLREFASLPRRINLLNLKRSTVVRDASLRYQCYRHRLYGKREDLEDAFSEVEGRAAPVLRSMATSQQPPIRASAPYATLIEFLSLQLLRTTAAMEQMRRAYGDLTDAVFDGSPPPGFPPDDAADLALSVQMLPEMAASLDGLNAHLVVSDGKDEFITSDNPAVRYNQYCQAVRGLGVTGTNCGGFELFLPLARTVALLLYDSGVYKVGRTRTSVSSRATSADVEAINALQIVNAEENVYFGNWEQAPTVQVLAKRYSRKRLGTAMRLVQADEEEPKRSVLVHQYVEMPALAMELSFVTLRREARRMEVHARARRYRKPVPRYAEPAPAPAGLRGRRTRFKVRREPPDGPRGETRPDRTSVVDQ
jgi:hypothetical protein